MSSKSFSFNGKSKFPSLSAVRPTSNRNNARSTLQRQQYRVLDASSRARRNRQALEQLERDNFHEDPHANLVMHKKAPKFQDIPMRNNSKGNLVQGKNPLSSSRQRQFNLPRNRMLPLAALIEDDIRNNAVNYATIATAPLVDPMELLSHHPSDSASTSKDTRSSVPSVIKRHFCAVCGLKAVYTCVVCGIRYCSSACQTTHLDTRCLKWTG